MISSKVDINSTLGIIFHKFYKTIFKAHELIYYFLLFLNSATKCVILY